MSHPTAPRKSLQPVDDRFRIIAAIRAGCAAADIHLSCSYPECNCKQMPKAIQAAIRTYEGGERRPACGGTSKLPEQPKE